MRKDFDKVLREPGRAEKDVRSKYGRKSNHSIEDREAFRRRGFYGQSGGMVRLQPNCRFLRKKCGQKWDEVYAEICEVNDIRSHPRPYIFEFIEKYVELSPLILDDGVYDASGRLNIYGGNIPHFYVDAEGILRVGEEPPRQKKKGKPEDYVVLDEYHQYHQVKGIWYLVTFAPWQGGKPIDILTGNQLVNDSGLIGRYGARIYAIAKRQANKKEVKWIKRKLDEKLRRTEEVNAE